MNRIHAEDPTMGTAIGYDTDGRPVCRMRDGSEVLAELGNTVFGVAGVLWFASSPGLWGRLDPPKPTNTWTVRTVGTETRIRLGRTRWFVEHDSRHQGCHDGERFAIAFTRLAADSLDGVPTEPEDRIGHTVESCDWACALQDFDDVIDSVYSDLRVGGCAVHGVTLLRRGRRVE